MRRIIFDVPLWSLYLHRAARGQPRADPSDTVERALEDELFERLYAGEAELMPEAQRFSSLANWRNASTTRSRSCQRSSGSRRTAVAGPTRRRWRSRRS